MLLENIKENAKYIFLEMIYPIMRKVVEIDAIEEYIDKQKYLKEKQEEQYRIMNDRHEKDLLNQTMNPDLRGFPLPKIKIDYPESIWDFKPEMVHIEEYEHGPKIDFEIAI